MIQLYLFHVINVMFIMMQLKLVNALVVKGKLFVVFVKNLFLVYIFGVLIVDMVDIINVWMNGFLKKKIVHLDVNINVLHNIINYF